MKGYSVSITGIGAAVPSSKITNDDLSSIIDTNDEWINSRTGIKERRVVSGDETLVSLLTKAGRKALARANVEASELDLIICATSIPDNLYPSTACEVQSSLNATRACAFNVVAACSGFVYVMKVAEAFIKSGMYKCVLILGGDLHSHALDWTDRTTCILFGDGAGAMLLSRSSCDDILRIDLYSDGTKASNLVLPLAGSNAPLVKKNDKKRPQFVSMNGREIYKFSVSIIPQSILEALYKLGIAISEVDYLVPHQANIKIVQALARKLSLKDTQLIANLQHYGNTSAASIPIALNSAIEDDKIKVPSTIVMVGFGAGLTWGVAVVRWRLGKA